MNLSAEASRGRIYACPLLAVTDRHCHDATKRVAAKGVSGQQPCSLAHKNKRAKNRGTESKDEEQSNVV